MRRCALLMLVILFAMGTACRRAQTGTSPSQPAKAEAGEDFFFDAPGENPRSVSIRIYKARRVLELYAEDSLLGRFRIALGFAPEGHKMKEGDGRTPEGVYYICTRSDRSSFTYFLGLSYPGPEDARRGLEEGLIDQAQHDLIVRACAEGRQPPWDTPLGGVIGIHGGGSGVDWTLGCIALPDEDICILWRYVAIGTEVEIAP